MNLKLVSLGLMVLLVNCKLSKENKCNQFRTGDFEYRSNGLLFEITREDTVQTESNKVTGDVARISIKWTDDCTYQLRLLESTAIYPDSINRLRMKSTVTVEITNWTDDYYIYKAKSDVADHLMEDTLWIKNR